MNLTYLFAGIGQPAHGDHEYQLAELGGGWIEQNRTAPRCVNTRGHDAKETALSQDQATPNQCACGCGEFTAKGRRFIRFHNLKDIPREPKGADYAVDPATGCWNWLKSTRYGYGQINIGGQIIGAHRVYYERHVEAIPDGLHIDHLCRNHACVNPDHLEPVTVAENIRRGLATKLKRRDIPAIRRRLAAGETQKAIARSFGVSSAAIRSIASGRTWKDA